eukprot:1161601-Pelagomonas_calceolata.AAC.12
MRPSVPAATPECCVTEALGQKDQAKGVCRMPLWHLPVFCIAGRRNLHLSWKLFCTPPATRVVLSIKNLPACLSDPWQPIAMLPTDS